MRFFYLYLFAHKQKYMATIKYLLQSKKDNSNIYVRFSINRTLVLKRKTGFIINPKDWSVDKSQPIQKNEELKIIKSKLDKLAVYINDAYNNAISTGVSFSGDWLQHQIDLFNNKIIVVDLDVLTNSIDLYVEKSDHLSKGSITNLSNLKKNILKYEKDVFNGKSILIRNIDLNFIETFKKHFKNKDCSINYIGSQITLIKSVVNHAASNGIPVSSEFNKITTVKEKKEPDEIIVLTELEQKEIKKAELKNIAHINARKWLLLGCLIGQRGNDLLNITHENIKDLEGMKIIELKQQKTGKIVAIPLLPEALEILESGLPYKINLENFNKYSKDVCEIAKINTKVKGKMRIDKKRTLTVGHYEKWKVISSHVCRRSFATNFYGRIPTSILMNITAHGSETVFLSYIGKTTYDNAYQMFEYFKKITPKAENSI